MGQVEARKLIPGGIDEYDEKSVARYDAAEKALTVCRSGGSGAGLK